MGIPARWILQVLPVTPLLFPRWLHSQLGRICLSCKPPAVLSGTKDRDQYCLSVKGPSLVFSAYIL